MSLRAQRKSLSRWADSQTRARFDYDTNEHLMGEMLNDAYFSTMYADFRPGDLIYVTDAAQQRATLIVADIDPVSHLVRLDIDTTHTQAPVTAVEKGNDAGFAIRWKGPRGGKFWIVSNTGEMIERDIESKHEAERRLKNMLEGVKAA